MKDDRSAEKWERVFVLFVGKIVNFTFDLLGEGQTSTEIASANLHFLRMSNYHLDEEGKKQSQEGKGVGKK